MIIIIMVIMIIVCDIASNKRRKLLDMVTAVNTDMIATGKLMDDLTGDLVPLVPRKDDES